MIDDNVHLDNGETFSKYHYHHYYGMAGFPHYHNTNIDKVCRFLDEWPFLACKDYDEMDRAYDIDYAHGLELDDEFGDPYGIPRNGMDDAEYRFILKCHRLAITCNGTLPELINFIAAVLGCKKSDVTLGMARHYDKNGNLVGEPDTIQIRDINIDDVSNDQVIPLLDKQLQLAVAADKRVDNIDFYSNTNDVIYTGTSNSLAIKVTSNVSPAVRVFSNAKRQIYLNVYNTAVAKVSVHSIIPRSIHAYTTSNLSTGMNITNTLGINAMVDFPDRIYGRVHSNPKLFTGVTFHGSGFVELN